MTVKAVLSRPRNSMVTMATTSAVRYSSCWVEAIAARIGVVVSLLKVIL